MIRGLREEGDAGDEGAGKKCRNKKNIRNVERKLQRLTC
jgi:hypothetical protein